MSTLASAVGAEDGDGFAVAIPLEHPVLKAHVVRGKVVLPGVAYFELAMAAARARHPNLSIAAFEDCIWIRPLLGLSDPVRFHIRIKPVGEGRLHFELADAAGLFGAGVMSTASGPAEAWPAARAVWHRVTENSIRRYSRKAVYDEFSRMGIDYGQFFRRINYVDVYDNQAVALLSNNDGTPFTFCNLLDPAFQSGMAVSIGTESGSLMPFSLGRLLMHQPPEFERSHTCFVVTEKITPYRTNITVYDMDSKPLLSVLDLGVKPSRL